jgi:hypothetical protein
VACAAAFAGAADFLAAGVAFLAGGMTISLGRFAAAKLLTPTGFEQPNHRQESSPFRRTTGDYRRLSGLFASASTDQQGLARAGQVHDDRFGLVNRYDRASNRLEIHG